VKSEVDRDLLRFVGFGFGLGRMILSFFGYRGIELIP